MGRFETRWLAAIKIGAKVVSHGRYVAFQMAEVGIPRHPVILLDLSQSVPDVASGA